MADKKQQIQELIEHNDELENYFRNTIIPQLFVDGHLKLRKFTPPAMKQFSLSASDVGKHIIDIKDNFRFPTIVDDIHLIPTQVSGLDFFFKNFFAFNNLLNVIYNGWKTEVVFYVTDRPSHIAGRQ